LVGQTDYFVKKQPKRSDVTEVTEKMLWKSSPQIENLSAFLTETSKIA